MVSPKRKKQMRKYYLKNKDTIKKQHREYLKTQHGKILYLLQSINKRCYDPNNKDYRWYGSKGIQNNLTYNDLKILWDRDRFTELKRPSIDRLDSEKDYSLDNCQFIEMSENISKEKIRKVVQKTLEGKTVKIWNSMNEAKIEGGFNNGSISACCRGKCKTTGGFKWEYYTK